MIYVKCAMPISEKPEAQEQVTGFIKHPGRAIPGLISKINKGMGKAYQVRQVLRAIDLLEGRNGQAD